MARVEASNRALRDLERLFDFVAETDPRRALAQLASGRAAFEVLADHPLLGRVAEDVVLIPAAMHQREAGYVDDQ